MQYEYRGIGFSQSFCKRLYPDRSSKISFQDLSSYFLTSLLSKTGIFTFNGLTWNWHFCQQSNILFENKCFLSGPFSFSLTTHACRQSGTDTKANDAITEIFLRFSNIPGIEVSNKNTYWDMVLQMPYFSTFMVSTTFP